MKTFDPSFFIWGAISAATVMCLIAVYDLVQGQIDPRTFFTRLIIHAVIVLITWLIINMISLKREVRRLTAMIDEEDVTQRQD